MKDALIVSMLSLVPRNRGAWFMGAMARSGLSGLMTRLFVTVYGVNLDEADGSLGDYPTLEALFTRTLKPGARPVAEGESVMVSPVDGAVAGVGTTTSGTLVIAGSQEVRVSDLLGIPFPGEADVAVLYLSPKDYHRVHVAREGTTTWWSYVPGTLWPVFPAAVRKVQGLFARNERVVLKTETTGGDLYSVLVGAFGVGRITVEGLDLVTNTGGAAASGDCSLPVERGGPMGVFHLGSTVILVAEPGRWTWSIQAGDTVRMGASIATLDA